MADESPIPAYEPMLAAYHRAFAIELSAMIGVLPIEPGQSVLDMACGDGVYSRWLAERVGPSGRVVAADIVPEYLYLARAESAKSDAGKVVEFATASIEDLPFDEGSFDVAWCAQSLYSLPEPVAALRQLLRVVKPGGVVAVLEADTLHHLILPWPIEVELSVRAAELRALSDASDHPKKFYVGRTLRKVFRKAGLGEIQARAFATDRAAPLNGDERTYLALALEALSRRVRSYLPKDVDREFDQLASPGSGRCLLDDPDFEVTCIDHLVWGRKAVGSPE